MWPIIKRIPEERHGSFCGSFWDIGRIDWQNIKKISKSWPVFETSTKVSDQFVQTRYLLIWLDSCHTWYCCSLSWNLTTVSDKLCSDYAVTLPLAQVHMSLKCLWNTCTVGFHLHRLCLHCLTKLCGFISDLYC